MQQLEIPLTFDLEGAADQAIQACDGDLRGTIKALIVANNTLIQELEHAWRESPPRRKRGW